MSVLDWIEVVAAMLVFGILLALAVLLHPFNLWRRKR
jgi:hypothetical protein